MNVKVHGIMQNLKGHICKFPNTILKSLNLSCLQRYHIHVGQLSEYFNIYSHDEPNNIIYFSNDALKNLLLDENNTFNIWRKDNHIYLGPVVGVFVNPKYLSKIIKNKPPESAIRLSKANIKGNCLLYFFSTEDINWIDNTIKGYVFNPSLDVYTSCWLPMPNVIYDRGVHFLNNKNL